MRVCFDESLLARRVGDVTSDLQLVAPPGAATMKDRVAFAGWSLIALLVLGGQVLLSPILIAAIVLVSRWGRPRGRPAPRGGRSH